MTTLIHWAPGRDLLPTAPQAETLILKKRSSQATLSQDLKAPLPPEAGASPLLKVNNGSTDLNMETVEISSPQAWEEAL